MDSSVIGFAAVFGALFVIANPFSGIPYLLGYSAPLTSVREKALGIALNAAATYVGALIILFAGKATLDFFGVSIPGLRVGGGFVILLSGLAMMNAKVADSPKSGRSLWEVARDLVRHGHHPLTAARTVGNTSVQAADAIATQTPPATTVEPTPVAPDLDQSQVAANKRAAYLSLMFPFAIPMTLGPGFMSTIMIAANDNPWFTVFLAITLLVGLQVVVFALGTPIGRLLGSFGMNILLRLVGLIVVVLAFEIMLAGLVKLLPGLAGSGS